MERQDSQPIGVLARQGINWDWVLAAARDHGVVPNVYRALQTVAPEVVPAAVLGRLRREFEENARRSLRLTRELVVLVDLFQSRGIPVLALKGPTLALSAYGDLGLRQFADLDVLVPRADVRRANQLLLSCGYCREPPLTDAEEAALLRQGCEWVFVRDDGTVVELHWDLVPAYFSVPFDRRSLWERRETVSVGGVTIPTLAADDLLLFLCVHGTKHLWPRLRWLCDIAELLGRRPELDLVHVLAQARALGAERMLLLGLWLARDLLGAQLPDGVLRRLRADGTVGALAAEVRARLFHAPGAPIDRWELCLFHLRARERWRDRLRSCARLAFLPGLADVVWVRLPGALSPLYRVVRPIRLTVTYGPRLIRSVWESWRTAHRND